MALPSSTDFLRFSKNLPAANLATFGRCRRRQALSTLVKSEVFESDVSFRNGLFHFLNTYIVSLLLNENPP